METDKTLYLIDGSSYIYRAFYAIQRLTDAKGMPTNAVYGFTTMLLKVLREKKPDRVCVVFDAPGPTFRHKAYEPYKGTRQKMPDDLVVQIPYIKESVALHGIPGLEVAGYEADDLIAMLAHRAVNLGMKVVVVSGDKDLLQIVRDPVVIQWDPQRDRLFDEAGVFEKYGVTPGQMADYLALMGDSSDNIPGVKGVGEKTAKQLIGQWGSLDGIYANLADITSASVRKKLEEGRESAYLSQSLVHFREDAPVETGPEEFTPSSPDRETLADFYRKLDFKTVLEAFLKERDSAEPVRKTEESGGSTRRDTIVRSDGELDGLLERLKRVERFSVDLETTSTDSMRAEIVGISICCEDGTAWYIPVAHCGPGSGRQLSREDVLRRLAPLLSSRHPGKVGQNIKYEWVVFRRHGVPLEGIAFDTMVASYLLDPGDRSHSLDRIVPEHLGEKKIAYEEVTGKGKTQVGFAEADVDRAAKYSCEDAETTWRLASILERKLREGELFSLYEDLELPLIPILAAMEHRGIMVDAGRLESLAIELEKTMDRRTGEIYAYAKGEFNVQSPKQLAEVLFERLGLRVVKKTKTGPSTDISVLEELAGDHPIVEHLLIYRTLSKLKGTYADALPRLIHPETGRIHTSYNQTVAATGRLSSSDPNLQNIPIRTEEGRKIREAFIPAPGCVFLSFDYSQIELRILAHYCRDEHLLNSFRSGEDVHRRTASEMFGIPPELVTSDMRRQAKTINFGIIYGMGAFGLARRLRISNRTAKEAIERYFARYGRVKEFIEETIRQTTSTGYTETLLGRRRAIPELASRNHNIRQQGERLAVNTPIQGTAADFIKKAMIDVDAALRKTNLKTAMLLQVHDELVFETPVEEVETARELVRAAMEGVWELAVPLIVDVGEGKNWAEAH